MKKNYIASDSAVIAAIMAISLLISGIFTAVSSEKHIEESLVRLHILANSDSELDQQLKLRVRDAVLASSDELFEPYSSSEEAEEALSGQLDKIKAIADSTLAENGCDDRTVCEITSMDIDRREYGEYTVPAGRYTALRITIGEGKGHNWWCVMYPPLCVPCAGVDMTDEEIMENTAVSLPRRILSFSQARATSPGFTLPNFCAAWRQVAASTSLVCSEIKISFVAR